MPPLIPTLVNRPPAGDGWLHEIKHDGYRTIIAVEDGRAIAFTRNGHNWTERYRRICDAAARLTCRSAVLDGEMVVQGENGISDFQALRVDIANGGHRLFLKLSRCSASGLVRTFRVREVSGSSSMALALAETGAPPLDEVASRIIAISTYLTAFVRSSLRTKASVTTVVVVGNSNVGAVTVIWSYQSSPQPATRARRSSWRYSPNSTF